MRHISHPYTSSPPPYLCRWRFGMGLPVIPALGWPGASTVGAEGGDRYDDLIARFREQKFVNAPLR